MTICKDIDSVLSSVAFYFIDFGRSDVLSRIALSSKGDT